MKRCSVCKIEKDVSEYWKHRSYRDGLQAACKPCWTAYQSAPARKAKNNARNLERGRAKRRSLYAYAWRLNKKFGMSLTDRDNLAKSQNYSCAICSKPESKCANGLYVDHDHQTGNVRALLCRECNVGLGYFSDQEDLLLKASDYLRKHNQGRLRLVNKGE
jgi:hypothetical protein